MEKKKMEKKKRMFKYQRTGGTTAEHCCVPLCVNTSKYNGVLSFFTFPADQEVRGKWVAAIRREHFTITSHTRVCSRHFREEDIRKPSTERGRRMLQRGAVPALFEWNNFSLPPTTTLPKEQLPERTETPGQYDVFMDHDYAVGPNPAGVSLVVEENASLKEEIRQLRQQVESLGVQQRFGIHRFAASDKDINFFTRFSSYDHLMAFWKLIEPATSKMVRVTRARAAAETNEEVTTPSRSTRRSLEPVDELFLFLMYLSVGLKEIDLGYRFNIHPSTVSRIIVTWINFLYTLLGSISIWMSPEQVQANLPVEFKNYPDTQVIIDCTELKCQTPSSILLQSEMYSTYKSHCTMKGLLGMAPHGAVTFVSSLYAGSVSDKEIFKQSGIQALLTESMAVMADKRFLIDECVSGPVHRPPFLSKQSQMPAHQVPQTQELARLRVHVESLFKRVKENKLFDTIIPLSIAGSINELFSVACLLMNYQCKPLVEAWAKK